MYLEDLQDDVTRKPSISFYIHLSLFVYKELINVD